MSIIDKALKESRKALRRSIKHADADKATITQFQEEFRADFETALAEKDKNGKKQDPEAKWNADSARVTTLARAIGSLAEFMAIQETKPGEKVKHKKVELAHLVEAYRALKPFCPDDPKDTVKPHREYCTTFSRKVDAGKKRRR
ncbi:MAG: hypothetical protein WD227_00405 [Vicinamibacterales bacterium]